MLRNEKTHQHVVCVDSECLYGANYAFDMSPTRLSPMSRVHERQSKVTRIHLKLFASLLDVKLRSKMGKQSQQWRKLYCYNAAATKATYAKPPSQPCYYAYTNSIIFRPTRRKTEKEDTTNRTQLFPPLTGVHTSSSQLRPSQALRFFLFQFRVELLNLCQKKLLRLGPLDLRNFRVFKLTSLILGTE